MTEVTIYRAMLESPTDPQLHRPEGPALVVMLVDYDALRAEVERLRVALEGLMRAPWATAEYRDAFATAISVLNRDADPTSETR